MKTRTLPALVALALAAAGLAACSPDSTERAQNTIDKAGRSTAQAVNKASDAVADAAKDAGAALERTADQASKDAADAAITASIKTDLMKDPDLSVLKIEVDTKQGVVTLNGVAPTQAAADRAGRIAIAVAGVSQVRNHVVPRQG
ncbi:BON domain-containing protein [Usitatibacter palustris]|uniref:BON domain-containing protein n=1 Tax=Usitatibacter palustris TaxID=2732487 RepID=A0A6M4H1T2_9PROT|nr:BON domain-containing protein [Usitatibacter palustris]QJR13466.1 hypothetical protein DSM104440_00250 [Usitatibacter palustris]